jgi:hypothetical protein
MTVSSITANFQNITANRAGVVRNATMEGRDYTVVPMVMIVEGVLSGSEGALYYPAEELAKVPGVWNHKPVVVYHPEIAGKGISACAPEILTAQKIGVIMNTTFKAGKLKAEAWIEPERANIVDTRIMDAINNNQVMELSTGLFTENESTPGEFSGKPYTAIARNYRPDHLAVLPDMVGACSIEDGAGFLRLNSAGLSDDQKKAMKQVEDLLAIRQNELSHDDVYSRLSELITAKYPGTVDTGSAWIKEVFADHFIYSSKSKLYKQDYAIDKSESVSLVGLPVEVQRKISYDPIVAVKNQREKEMEKKEIVDGLIANTAWVEEDREFLMTLNEAQLAKLVPAEKKEDEEVKDETPVTDNAAPVATVASFIANAPKEIQEVLRDSITTHNQRKAELVATITANKRNTFKPGDLINMGIGELTAIANLAAPVETPEAAAHRSAVFMGMAPITNATGDTEALELPVMNFGKEDSAS